VELATAVGAEVRVAAAVAEGAAAVEARSPACQNEQGLQSTTRYSADEFGAVESSADRVGLGWRPELGASILAHLDSIDIVEVIADDYFEAAASELRGLRALAREVPVVLHGVGLGLATASRVDATRLDQMARVCGEVRPLAWSEHIAFVRAGGTEIGHLAAPPRSAATIDGLLRNLDRARAAVGSDPAIENIATLVEPPGSVLTEPEFLSEIAGASRSPLLLDLHNLLANALNFGSDPRAMLGVIPLDRVRFVHIAGGVLIPLRRNEGSNSPQRLLDDHLHDVPDDVYSLLEEVARRAPQPLTVILERDGEFPAFGSLLDQISRARAALTRGRRSASAGQAA
jgi:uncharacterized protein (UPF0276 family)